ncbi:MAG: DUF177 domain-containing protein [Acidobacteriota bacterium]
MKIRLDQLGERPFTWRETLNLGGEELAGPDGSALEVGPVDCRGTVTPTSSGFVLSAQLSYSHSMACSRCLGPWNQEVDAEVGLLIELADDSREAPEELSQDDLGILNLKDPEFDTLPQILEHIQLGIPMKPLCRPDCAGLCGGCGNDLNAKSCECEAEVDPRWASLAALKIKKPN